MSEELPKLDLLIKMMKMTMAEDSVALVALRKANAMLSTEGWDWEKLLRGKVTIIGDPFANITAPPMTTKMAQPQPVRNNPPPAAAWSPPPRRSPPPPPPPRVPTPTPRPVRFEKLSNGDWGINSHQPLTAANKVNVVKRNGAQTTVEIDQLDHQNKDGYYIYKIKAKSKWERRFANSGQPDLDALMKGF